MMFINIVRCDLNNGILKKWKFYLFTGAFFSILAIFAYFDFDAVLRMTPNALKMTDVVIQCCDAVRDLLVEFKNFKRSKTLKQLIIRINDLEEKSDKLFIESIRGLYTESENPIRIIAWRDIYIYLERCADACEHVADVVESVIMKNS